MDFLNVLKLRTENLRTESRGGKNITDLMDPATDLETLLQTTDFEPR
jgi:hypothetical protein